MRKGTKTRIRRLPEGTSAMKYKEYQSSLEKLIEERTHELKAANLKLSEENDKLKKTEEELRDQLGFFSTVIDTVPVPIFIRDKEKRYVDCNSFFESFLGRKREDIIGKHLSEILGKPFSAKYVQMDDELLKSQGIQSYEYQFPDSKGEIKDVIFNKAALVKADGEIAGVVGSFQDITEHKTLEKEIKKALESEKDLNELKTRFISTASHEFRTPLAEILASADLLALYGRNWPEDKYMKHANQIRKSVKYMTELLEDVLTINRSGNEKAVFNPEYSRLREICTEVMETAKMKAGDRHVLIFKYKSDDEYFYIDKKIVKQMLCNLLSNAVKYSPDGGLVELSVEIKNSCLELKVTDHGIGIPEEEKKNLAIPFFRAGNAAAIPGTGLGLSIVSRCAEMHGGRLFFESRINEGSIFTVMIPVNGSGNKKYEEQDTNN